MDSTALITTQENNQQLQPIGDIGITAAASHAKAMVEARYIMAMRNPRDWDGVRQDLMKECRRPALAQNKSVYYTKTISGKNISDLGIRFVEVAFRCMRNVMPESMLVHEDAWKEIHRVTVSDIENNITYSQDVQVKKTVERSKPLDDGSYISVRKNSKGVNVFTVEATEDSLSNKRGALISKAIRNLGLRLVPGDLQDEAKEIILSIRRDKAAADPDGERKKIIDAFGELGVKVGDLTSYLGHDIGQSSPAEIVHLRGLYGAVSSGETTWVSIMEEKRDREEEEAKELGIDDEKPKRKPKASKKKEEEKAEPKPEPLSTVATETAMEDLQGKTTSEPPGEPLPTEPDDPNDVQMDF
jgi:hypothetical protein